MSTASETSAPKAPAKRAIQPLPYKAYHKLRKWIHFVCFLIFVALPFSNFMRFDIPRQRFYFAGVELWISEFGIIFFSLMFLMFIIVAMAVMYGRIYCGYLCPQTIFSEVSVDVENRIRKFVNKRFIHWKAPVRQRAARAAFYVAVGVASVFLAFVFISYFVEPRDLLARLMSFDLRTAGGIAGASVTLITFLDFAFVRQTFCTTVCPYGYLQGMLTDKNTLLVQYRDGKFEQKVCIECKKCVRVCEMNIDIRNSPYQIECVHCGECIDACNEVLSRLGKPGLIHYTWGEHGNVTGERSEPWYMRLGIRDRKRLLVMLVLVFYTTGLGLALSLRRTVLVQISPVRTPLYRLAADGSVANHFRVKLANRGGEHATLMLGIEGLPGARLAFTPNPVPLAAGEVTEKEFDIVTPPGAGQREVEHFAILANSPTERKTDRIPMTFLSPPEKRR